MGLTDIFSISTLICLGIMILLLGLASMFFIQKISEQNHKIGSMLGLVSTMAEELNFVRSRVQILSAGAFSQNGGSTMQMSSSQIAPDSLIAVSDDDDDEDISEADDDDEDEADDDDEEDEDEADEDEDDEDEADEEDAEEEKQNIKTINMGETLDINFQCEALVEEEEEEAASSNSELEDDLESVNDENFISGADDLDNNETLTLTNTDFIKAIDISNLEDSQKESQSDAYDYKKMSLNKLRSVVVEKGLVSEASKLKKNELLKLLSSE
jgi:hypothetical protein